MEAVMTWSDQFSVGIKEMDLQHRWLITLVNQLQEEMHGGSDRDRLRNVLVTLAQYTKTHFADEERLMQIHDFPDLESHRLEHETLTNQVTELIQEYKAGQANMTAQVLSFLKDWLANHIQGTDRAYGLYLNQNGIY